MQTSERMSRVKQRDTAPELAVRRALRALGKRYRICRADLPSRPDLSLSSQRIAIFVHGCFWHRHAGCARASFPATNQLYWRKKFECTVARDLKAEASLLALGWHSVVIWECETRSAENLRTILAERLARASRSLPPAYPAPSPAAASPRPAALPPFRIPGSLRLRAFALPDP